MQETDHLNQLLLDSLPYPAMLIRKDRIIVAANKVAKQVGASIGSLCWKAFGQSKYISEEAKQHLREHGCPPPGGAQCTFCLADQAMESPGTTNAPEVHAFGRIWDTHWIPLDEQVYLHFAIDITDRKQADKELRERTHELGERVKELSCLYGISDLVARSDATLEDVVRGTVGLIPASWQYPEITCARITLDGQAYCTPGFMETPWRQSCDIAVGGERIGVVEVYYREQRPQSDEGPFQEEERSLIKAIAERIGRIAEQERVEQERAALQRQLNQAQKLEAVGQLASGVAHDFSNLLTAIFGYLSLVRNTLPPDHKAIDLLSGVQEAADQAAGVTRALLTLSQEIPTEKNPVELRRVVERSVRLLHRVLPAGIEIVTDMPAPEPVWIHADGTQIQQIVMNLAINARDAMPEGGTLRVSVSRVPADQSMADSGVASAAPSPRAPSPGFTARLVVSDTGAGIPPELRERIFEPFFTTKPRGLGTGLGLSVIHGIVKDHGGRISVESELGRGATFTVELPAITASAVPESASSSLVPPRGHGEKILLAEDNRHVRRIMASSLRELGYEVDEATDAASLMGYVERQGSGVRLLLVVDVDLPQGSGLDCLRELRAGGLDWPAIVITGGADADLEEQLDGHTALLRKPFKVSDLGDIVARFIEAPAGLGSPT